MLDHIRGGEIMGIAVKKRKVPFLALTYLASGLTKLNTTCIADFRRVNKLVTEVEAQYNTHLQAMVKAFFDKHHLDEKEEITPIHPLYQDWVATQQREMVDCTIDKLQEFKETELDAFMQGREISFYEKKALVEYTIK